MLLLATYARGVDRALTGGAGCLAAATVSGAAAARVVFRRKLRESSCLRLIVLRLAVCTATGSIDEVGGSLGIPMEVFNPLI